jgi:phosphohistidine phosphatase
MKTLYIHRHAKAVKEGYEKDFSRNLRPRGIDDAHSVGRYLKHRELLADLIISSPANRALQTAELIAGHTGESLVTSDQLYEKGWLSVLEVLKAQSDSVQSIRVVGHNPDLEDLCAGICGIRSGGIHLATCGILCVSCDIISWSELGENTGTLEWSIRPGHL